MSQDSLLSSIPFTPLRMDPITIREPVFLLGQAFNQGARNLTELDGTWNRVDSFSDQHARLLCLQQDLPSSLSPALFIW